MGLFDFIVRSTKPLTSREDIMEKATETPVLSDPIAELAKKMHANSIPMMIMRSNDETSTLRSYIMVPNGVNKQLPVFEAGQYVVITFKVGDKLVSRPFQLASAPSQVKTNNASIQVILRDLSEIDMAKYIFDNWRIGMIVEIKMPYGDFYYESLRDKPRITAVVSGNGITPIYSLAKEIHLRGLDLRLTIIYGASKISNTLFYKEINKLVMENINIKVVYVFSEEPTGVGERGAITPELIKKYSLLDCSYFVAGNSILCERTLRQLMDLGIRGKRIKWNLTRIGRPNDNGAEFYITVLQGKNKSVIKCKNYETISAVLERGGFRVYTNCMAGKCGFCRSELIKGDIYISRLNDYRKAADKVNNYFHACATYPLSDLVIAIPI